MSVPPSMKDTIEEEVELFKYLDEENPNETLRSLCRKGEVEELTDFLRERSSDVDINAPSEEGWTCLHEVITHGCQFVEVSRLLVEDFGASPNSQDVHGDSPLHSALLYHNLSNVFLLLRHGADLNLVNALGRHPVHVADDVETLQLILDHSLSECDRQDRSGNGPLHFAVVSKDLDRVSLLISRGSDVNLRNHSASTPLHLVNGDIDIAKALLQTGKADLNLGDAQGNTALHLAVRGRHKDLVRLFMTLNADPNKKNSAKKTSFNLAKDKEMKRILANKSIPAPPLPPPSTSIPAKKSPVRKKSPVPPVIDRDLLPDKPSNPGILRKASSLNGSSSEPPNKRPRLSFNEVIDYSGVENVENEKRVKVPPIYIEPQFSSDED